MQIIGIGVPLYQAGIDMLMLALISTTGSKNTKLLEKKDKKLDDVSVSVDIAWK